MLKLSKITFILINTILLTLLNTGAFVFVAKHLESAFLAFALAMCYFCLIFVLLNIIFIKYFTKFISILFITSATFSVYFMSSYGILIDSDMILNVIQTDAKEASKIFNIYLILIGFSCIVFAYFVFKVEIKKDFKLLYCHCLSIINLSPLDKNLCAFL